MLGGLERKEVSLRSGGGLEYNQTASHKTIKQLIKCENSSEKCLS